MGTGTKLFFNLVFISFSLFYLHLSEGKAQCTYGENFTDNNLSEWTIEHQNNGVDWSGSTVRFYDDDGGSARHDAHTHFYQKFSVPTCDLQFKGRFKLENTNTNRDQSLYVQYTFIDCNSNEIGYVRYYTKWEGCSGTDGCPCGYCSWCNCTPLREVSNWNSGTNNALVVKLKAENTWKSWDDSLTTILNNELTGINPCNIDSVKMYVSAGGAWGEGSDFYFDYVWLECNSTVACNGCGLTLSSAVTDVSCNGGNDGAIDLSVSGGTSPYTYSWSNGDNTQDADTLTAGTYSVTVSDGNACPTVDTTSAVVNEPPPLVTDTTVTTVSCNGGSDGSVDLNISGGVPPYDYSWSNGDTTEDISNVPAGTYTVTVTDSNDCIVTTPAIVSQPPAIITDTIVTPVTCNGGSDGNITLNVSGGIPPYNYIWSTGDTTQNISNVSAGTYTVTITDDNNCRDTTIAIVPEPPAITVSSIIVDVSCHGGSDGSITANVSGGSGSYNYNWSNGDTIQTISSLPADTFYLTVSDTNGCTSQDTFLVNEPAPLNGMFTTQKVSCPGRKDGQAAISVTGGTSPYDFNWSTGDTTSNVNGLSSGTYLVTATDSNGCRLTDTATIGLFTVTATAGPDTTVCKGEEVPLTAAGGSTYEWIPSGSLDDPNIPNPTAQPNSSTSYSVIVTDSSCSDTTTVQVNINPPPSVTTSGDTTIPAGGSTPLQATGGSTYEWKPVSGLSAPNTSDPVAQPNASTTYVVTVTDSNGCSQTDTLEVTVVEGQLFIPTAFSPNGDGQNDRWRIEGVVTDIHVFIYDRWGEQLFETQDIGQGWDGQYNGEDVSTGVYVYYIEATLPTGETIKKKGNVTLLR